MKPFHELPLFTGSSQAGMFEQSLKQIGGWKGLIRLMDKDSDPEHDAAVKEMLKPQPLMLRYVLACNFQRHF